MGGSGFEEDITCYNATANERTFKKYEIEIAIHSSRCLPHRRAFELLGSVVSGSGSRFDVFVKFLE
jgi:hypothetical protein